MVFCTLRSLVLRGVSVLRDGQNVGLRLGAESKAHRTTRGIRTNPQRPTICNQRQGFMPAVRPHPTAYEGVDAVASGAGRSPGSSNVGRLSRRRPARIAGRAILFGWTGESEAPKSNAVKRLCRTTCGKRAAAADPAASARPLPSAWRQPAAGRTPSASTWDGVLPA